MRRSLAATAVVALGALGLGACTGDAPAPASSTASSTASTATSSPPSSAAPALAWRPVPGSVANAVTRSKDATLTVIGNGAGWRLGAPGGRVTGHAPPGWQVGAALLDDDWAVVVLQDKSEQRPGRARVVDLATGTTSTVDGSSAVPTTTGGSWALGQGRLLHATTRGGQYCLASVELASGRAEVAWCAPRRHGFNAAQVGPGGDSVLTFDDGTPACRTEAQVADGTATPFPGVPDCKAWEGVLLDGGAVWSVIPRESAVEVAHFYARAGAATTDLGPGTSGSLVWCGDAAYFTRDQQRKGGSAALMRWSPADGLTSAYEVTAPQAFLEPPRCGGSAITVTARTSAGDRQVSALLP